MNFDKKLAPWRSGRKRARKGALRLGMEQLEARQLLAGSITVEITGATKTHLSAATLSHLGNYTNGSDYKLAPSALTGATSGLTFHATGAITFDDPVANMPVSLDAESLAQVIVDADISSNSGKDITLVGSNSLSGMATKSGVVFTGSTVTSGGDLTVDGTGYAELCELGRLRRVPR